MGFSLSCLHQAKPEDTLNLCQLLNNDLATTVASYPRRFVGLGTLPMQAPELAVQEMERCVKELGFPGVQIGTHINEWDLNARELFPVYAVSSGAAQPTPAAQCLGPGHCWVLAGRRGSVTPLGGESGIYDLLDVGRRCRNSPR